MDNPPKKLLDQVRDLIRLKHYSIRTEQSYIPWIKRYIYFHKKRHPKDMGGSRNRGLSQPFSGKFESCFFNSESGL